MKRGDRGGLKIDNRWDAPRPSEEELRQRVCGGKELRSERDAKTAAQMHNGRGLPMRAYECPY